MFGAEVQDPHDLNLVPPRLFHESIDVCNHCFALVVPLDDAILHINNEECGVGSILESSHWALVSI